MNRHQRRLDKKRDDPAKRAALAAVPAVFAEALRLHQSGRLADAETLYRKILAVDPRHADSLQLLGVIAYQAGRPDLAVELIGQAIALNSRAAPYHCNLGNALRELGRLEEAESAFRRALALDAVPAEIHNNLGCTLYKQNRLADAEACFRQALARQPGYAQALANLGNTLQRSGRLAEADAAYAQALALDPGFAEARLCRTLATLPIYVETPEEGEAALRNFSGALDDLTAWSATHPASLGRVAGHDHPFYIAYRPGNPRALLSRYGDLLSRAVAASWPGLRPPAARPPRQRLRLGIVSGQIHQSSVWFIVLRGLIEHLDRRQFELFLYHTDARTDAETAWATSRADAFVQGPQPPAAWLERITADQPDILLYPEVGMDAATLTLAALRLAPLQVASWGHPVTTGLPSIDLFLSGELLDSPAARDHYRETLVRLPGTGVCTRPIPGDPQPVEAARLGLPEDRRVIRFILCQTSFKFDPAHDALYARIAKAVGSCQFWLSHEHPVSWSSERVMARLARSFQAEGLDPQAYLRPVPWLPRSQFLGLLDEMDVYLDCPAFSGYTTAWQALHQGIPIVTLEGDFLRQRLAAALLRRIGQTDDIATDGIAATAEDYVARAVRLAAECRNPAARARRREALRGAAPAADDDVEVVRALEQRLVEEFARRSGTA